MFVFQSEASLEGSEVVRTHCLSPEKFSIDLEPRFVFGSSDSFRTSDQESWSSSPSKLEFAIFDWKSNRVVLQEPTDNAVGWNNLSFRNESPGYCISDTFVEKVTQSYEYLSVATREGFESSLKHANQRLQYQMLGRKFFAAPDKKAVSEGVCVHGTLWSLGSVLSKHFISNWEKTILFVRMLKPEFYYAV